MLCVWPRTTGGIIVDVAREVENPPRAGSVKQKRKGLPQRRKVERSGAIIMTMIMINDVEMCFRVVFDPCDGPEGEPLSRLVDELDVGRFYCTCERCERHE